jgi:hypothetical protein
MKLENNDSLIKTQTPKEIRNVRLFVLFIGSMLILLGLFELFDPEPKSVFTGRLAWLYRWLVETFGPDAYPMFHIFLGFFLIVRAFIDFSHRDSSK